MIIPTYIAPGGRVGWPEIVQYRVGDTIMNSPPMDERPYYVLVFDLLRYDELARSGAIYSPEHTGRHMTMIDQRKATQ